MIFRPNERPRHPSGPNSSGDHLSPSRQQSESEHTTLQHDISSDDHALSDVDDDDMEICVVDEKPEEPPLHPLSIAAITGQHSKSNSDNLVHRHREADLSRKLTGE